MISHFYILFNENLLDEEKMQEMITQKQKEAEAVKKVCKFANRNT
ncbi:MAG: hypothetical protein ACLVIY_08845 [Anaerobutyricum soehngenii]